MKRIIAGLFILSSIIFAAPMGAAYAEEIITGDGYEAMYTKMDQNPLETMMFFREAMPNAVASLVGVSGHASYLVNYSDSKTLGVYLIDKDSILIVKVDRRKFKSVTTVLKFPDVDRVYTEHLKTGAVM